MGLLRAPSNFRPSTTESLETSGLLSHLVGFEVGLQVEVEVEVVEEVGLQVEVEVEVVEVPGPTPAALMGSLRGLMA